MQTVIKIPFKIVDTIQSYGTNHSTYLRDLKKQLIQIGKSFKKICDGMKNFHKNHIYMISIFKLKKKRYFFKRDNSIL